MERLGDTLRAALQRLEQSGAINDEAAAAHAAYGAQMEAAVARARRRENLIRGGIYRAMKPEIRAAIIRGELAILPEPSGRSLKIVRRWAASSAAPAVLGLQGARGCGKSVACQELIAEHGGYLRSASQVASAFASRAPEAMAEQMLMRTCSLLVIDDLGTEHQRDRDWMKLALRELLEARLGSSTLITTNHTLEETLALYPDERIASRAAQIAWLVDSGPDLRSAA